MIPEPLACFPRGRPVLVWQCPRPWLMISSAPSGGGLGTRDWVLNATVRTDDDLADPDADITAMAAGLGLPGVGTGLLTAVDVRDEVTSRRGGVHATVTTGLSHPTWAAAPDEVRAESLEQSAGPNIPGTINAVCWSPLRLSESALVNTVATVAEAKAQALFEAGVDGSGTCTDATVVACPVDGAAETCGGPRSRVGSELARAVHAGVRDGLRTWYAR